MTGQRLVPVPLAAAPGAHVCAVADDPPTREQLVAEWVREGLDRGERVVWIAPDAQVFDWLDTYEVDWREPRERGQLGLLPPREVLRFDSLGDIATPLARAADLAAEATAGGYRALRIGAEAANALAVMPGVPAQIQLEAAWERYTATTGMSFMCVYDRQVYGDAFAEAASAHPRCLTDGLAIVTVAGGVVHVAGEIDVSNADLVGDYLEALAVGGIVLDLSALEFVDVRGAGRFVELRRSLATEGRLRISAPSRVLNRVLTLAGWHDEVDLISPTLL